MDFAQDVARPHARVGQPEAVAAAQAIVGADHAPGQVRPKLPHLDEAPVVERFGKPEDYPPAIRSIVQLDPTPALEAVDLRGDIAACSLDIHQRAAGARDGELQVLTAWAAWRGLARDQRRDDGLVFRRRHDGRAPFHEREHAAADEVHLEAEEIVLLARNGGQRINARLNIKKARDEAAYVRRHRDEQGGQRDRRTRCLGRRSVRLPLDATARGHRPRPLRRSVRTRRRAARGRADQQMCSLARQVVSRARQRTAS